MEITNKGEPTAALLFGQGQPLERKPVIPSLYKLAELTLRTIQTLELFWFVEGRKVARSFVGLEPPYFPKINARTMSPGFA